MPTPAATSEPTSLKLPEQISGKWASAVILTYGAQLSFFQRYLIPQLSQVPLRLILADGSHLPDLMRNVAEETELLRQVNRSYLVAPIRHPRAAHAKIILLAGPSTGRLLVGSGNLGPQGYTTPGELWHVYSYDETNTQHLLEFAAVRDLIDTLGKDGLLDPPVLEVLSQTWRLSPWIPASAPSTTTPAQPVAIRHNHDVPLARAFLDAIAVLGQPVQTLTVYAPFYDSDAGALAYLLQQLKPHLVRVLLRHDTSVNPNALTKTLKTANATELFDVTVSTDEGTYLHAKWLHATTADHDVLLTGSANLSRPALLSTWDQGNIEAGVIQVRPHGGFDHLYTPLSLTPINDLDALTLHFEPKPAREAVSGPVLLWSRLDGRRLILAFTEAFDATTLDLVSTDGNAISAEHTTWNGTQLVVILTAADAEQFAEGRLTGLIVTCPGEDARPQVTLPYQLGRLNARLNTAASNRLLERTGNLPDTDRERLELLAQLEQSLILDQASAWRTSNPTEPAPDGEPGQEADTRWEDIDWPRLKTSPRFGAYGRGIFTGPPHTDIEVILASIYSRLHPAEEPAGGAHGTGLSEEPEDDLARESREAAADPEQAEQRENEDPHDGQDKDDEVMHRPMAVSTRTRMAFGRVVKRYRASLSNQKFVEELGPVATVTNAVIVHALLAQLLLEDGIDQWIAADAHLAIWQLLWGSAGTPGLLDGLDPEERAAADDLVTRGGLRAATWLALSNYAVDEVILDQRRSDFRAVAQHLALSAEFDLDQDLCRSATPTTALESLDDIWSLAARLSDTEVIAATLEPLGLPASAGQRDADYVNRMAPDGHGSRKGWVEFLKVTKPLPDLTIHAALAALDRLALASWFNDDGRDYWRIKFAENGKDVCFYDYNTESGSCLIAGEDLDFDGLDLHWPAWWDRFAQLHQQLGGEAAA
jgi:hypothetical protein